MEREGRSSEAISSSGGRRAGRPVDRRRAPALVVLALGVASLGILVGCGGEAPTAPGTLRLDGLVFRGSVDVRESFPVQLGFRLVARNTGDAEVHLVTDGCGLGALAYRDPDRSGPPAWNGRPAGACRASPAPVTVPAGDSVEWSQEYSAGEVLGDSLPDGRYFFTASLGRVSLAGSDASRRIEVAAGEAVLAVPRSAGL